MKERKNFVYDKIPMALMLALLMFLVWGCRSLPKRADAATYKQWGVDVTDKKLNERNDETGVWCNEYAQWALEKFYGVTMKGLAADMYNQFEAMVNNGTAEGVYRDVTNTSTDALKPGDILIFCYKKKPGAHIAILGGNGEMHHGGTKADRGVRWYATPAQWLKWNTNNSSGGNTDGFVAYRLLKDKGNAAMKKTSSLTSITGVCPNMYSLAGATYSVSTGYDGSGRVGILTTYADGSSNTLELTAGTYYARETKAPVGYEIDPNVYTVNVTAGNTTSFTSVEKPKYAIADIVLEKISTNGGQADMSGAEFSVKYYDATSATGSPVRTWNLKTTKDATNGKYYAKLDNAHLLAGSSALFMDGNKVVIPRGTITIQETKAPKGFKIDRTVHTYRVEADGTGKIEYNQKKTPIISNDKMAPGITTTAVDLGTGNRMGRVLGNSNIQDTVSYKGLTPGETYTVKGVLMDKETNKKLLDKNNKEITAETTFTANASNSTIGDDGASGKVVLKYPIDSVALKGKSTVVFAYLYNNGTLVASHADINAVGQTVVFPDISTKATSFTTKTQIGSPSTEEIINDQVTLKNLIVGHVYRLSGKIMKKNGAPTGIVVNKTFTATQKDMVVNVEFKLNSSNFNGETIVITQELLCTDPFNPKEEFYVIVHNNLNDENQTIYYPKIITSATSMATGTKIGMPSAQEKITDKVDLTNLTVGKKYTLKGKLMDKGTNAPVKNAQGQEVTAEKTFTADNQNMTVTLEFVYNSLLNKGKTTVVFQDLYYEGKLVGTHANINDAGQSVAYPSVGTSAKSKEANSNVGVPGTKETVIDKVDLKNLVVGNKYTVKGRLMEKGTGKPLADKNGNGITAEKTFTATQKDMVIELQFTYDSSLRQGKTTVVFEDLYYGEKLVGTHADINDVGQSIEYLEMKTTATSQPTNSHIGMPGVQETIIDKVSAKNLIVGKEYTVKGKLMNKSTGQPLLDKNNKEIVAEKTFTATQKNMVIELQFTYDSSLLKGETIVVFEDMYHNGILVGTHSDLTDEEQSIYYPDVKTSATSMATGTKVGMPSAQEKITDKVDLTNLTVGKKYTLKGKLMDKGTNAPVKNAQGQEVTAEKTFTADNQNMTVTLEFVYNSLLNKGKTTVVFQDLYYEGKLVGTHANINDAGQSVAYPSVGTSAKSKEANSNVGVPGEQETVVDKVDLKNLIVGNEYTVKGKLMAKETGKPLLDKDNKGIITEKTFVANKTNMTIELEFTYDSSLRKGKTTVVFENLYHEDKLVGTHADINDAGQSVDYPDLRTTATSQSTNSRVGMPGEQETIIDQVFAKNLIIGKEYTVKGRLMDKSEGTPLLDENSNEIVAEKTFTATQKDMVIELQFTYNSSLLKGKTIVVFENMYHNGILVGTHSDLEDEEQSIGYPAVRTFAISATTGTNVGETDEAEVIKDTVEVSNLKLDKEYTVKGKLMDKETGEPVKDAEGNEVVAEQTFVAEQADMVLELQFTYDSSLRQGQTTVVFEELFYEGNLVATHSDIEDANQSILYPELRTNAVSKEVYTNVGMSNEQETIIDIVDAKNLVVGQEYTIKGKLMDKETGEPILDKDGNEITAEKVFIAEEENMTVELEFTYDSSLRQGEITVAFEDMYHNDRLVGTHADIEDTAQSLYYPDVRTSASSVATNSQLGLPGLEERIKDKVQLTNLIVDKEYTVKGKLMDKKGEKPILDSLGKEVTAEKTFVAEAEQMEIELEFVYDSSQRQGEQTVVFEDLYHNNSIVATHSDINDEGQTITYPDLGTQASLKNNGVAPNGVITIVDNVAYTNLPINKAYTVKGVLMNKHTGTPFLVNGEKIVAEKTFTPATKDGNVDVEFNVKASDVQGNTFVVFEDVYYGESKIVTHSDINSKSQTVTIDRPRTADNSNLLYASLVMAFMGVFIAFGINLLKKQH